MLRSPVLVKRELPEIKRESPEPRLEWEGVPAPTPTPHELGIGGLFADGLDSPKSTHSTVHVRPRPGTPAGPAADSEAARTLPSPTPSGRKRCAARNRACQQRYRDKRRATLAAQTARLAELEAENAQLQRALGCKLEPQQAMQAENTALHAKVQGLEQLVQEQNVQLNAYGFLADHIPFTR